MGEKGEDGEDEEGENVEAAHELLARIKESMEQNAGRKYKVLDGIQVTSATPCKWKIRK